MVKYRSGTKRTKILRQMLLPLTPSHMDPGVTTSWKYCAAQLDFHGLIPVLPLLKTNGG